MVSISLYITGRSSVPNRNAFSLTNEIRLFFDKAANLYVLLVFEKRSKVLSKLSMFSGVENIIISSDVTFRFKSL